jgi:hypothetical protein
MTHAAAFSKLIASDGKRIASPVRIRVTGRTTRLHIGFPDRMESVTGKSSDQAAASLSDKIAATLRIAVQPFSQADSNPAGSVSAVLLPLRAAAGFFIHIAAKRKAVRG